MVLLEYCVSIKHFPITFRPENVKRIELMQGENNIILDVSNLKLAQLKLPRSTV